MRPETTARIGATLTTATAMSKTAVAVLIIDPGSRAALYPELGDELSGIELPSLARLYTECMRRKAMRVAIVDAHAHNLSPRPGRCAVRDFLRTEISKHSPIGNACSARSTTSGFRMRTSPDVSCASASRKTASPVRVSRSAGKQAPRSAQLHRIPRSDRIHRRQVRAFARYRHRRPNQGFHHDPIYAVRQRLSQRIES